jgi:trans-aconitate methyltransferase
MSFEPEAIRAFEHAGWQRAASTYGNSFAHATVPYIVSLLEAAEISPGQHVLDVACGPGYLAAAECARGATAHGLDFSAEMVAIARSAHPEVVVIEGTPRICRIPTTHFMQSYQASESITFLVRNSRLPSAGACSNRAHA